MQVTRRHVLAISAATAAVGAIGAGGLAIRWWDQAPGTPMSILSEEEAHIVRAIAGTAYPPTEPIPLHGSEAGLDVFFDSLLGHVPDSPQRLLKLLLHGLDGATVLTHGATFRTLSESQQSDALEGWLHHEMAEVRSATQSLLLLMGMGWTIHPKVAPTMQRYHSCGYGA